MGVGVKGSVPIILTTPLVLITSNTLSSGIFTNKYPGKRGRSTNDLLSLLRLNVLITGRNESMHFSFRN